jgi:YVTN family beta-propeller protein
MASIPVGSHPDSLCLTPDDQYLLVANSDSNDISVIKTDMIRTQENTLFTVIPTGAHPSTVVIK